MKTLFNIITFCVVFRELICDALHTQSPNDKEQLIWSKDQCDAYCFDIAKPLLNHLLHSKEEIDTLDNMKEKINKLEKELEISKMQYKAKDDLLNEKESQLKAKDILINEKETQLKGKDILINEKESQLKGKDALIYEKDELIKKLRTQMDKDSIVLEENKQKLKDQEENLPETCPFSSLNRIQRIQISGREPFDVSCVSPSSSWTVIQRRLNGSVDFHRDWEDYENGFGDIRGEFFIGLDKLHLMTQSKPHELYILMRDVHGTTKYARYNNFNVGSKEENYKLISVGSYTGTVGDSFSHHVGYMFTTRDRDNDITTNKNCAADGRGGWWFFNCATSFLNGKYHEDGKDPDKNGVAWGSWKKWDYTISLTFTEMMIRPTL